MKTLHVNPRKAADIRDGIEDERKRFETEEIDYVEDHETWQRYKDIILFKNGSKPLTSIKLFILPPNFEMQTRTRGVGLARRGPRRQPVDASADADADADAAAAGDAPPHFPCVRTS